MENEGWYITVMNVAGNYSDLGSDAWLSLVLALYCVNPPDDDGCPIGICPNPDVAGTLLRIARKFLFPFLLQMTI